MYMYKCYFYLYLSPFNALWLLAIAQCTASNTNTNTNTRLWARNRNRNASALHHHKYTPSTHSVSMRMRPAYWCLTTLVHSASNDDDSQTHRQFAARFCSACIRPRPFLDVVASLLDEWEYEWEWDYFHSARSPRSASDVMCKCASEINSALILIITTFCLSQTLTRVYVRMCTRCSCSCALADQPYVYTIYYVYYTILWPTIILSYCLLHTFRRFI